MPRAGLTASRVVAGAVELVDLRGRSALTLAALARAFDVATPSLYKHVESLSALKEQVAEVALTQLADVLHEASAGGPASLARAARTYAAEHPGLYAIAQVTQEGASASVLEASSRVVSIISDTLRAADALSLGEVDSVRMFRALVHGFIILERDDGFGLPASVDDSFDAVIASMVSALTR